MTLTAKIDKKSGCMGTWEPIDGVIKDVVGFARRLWGEAQLTRSFPPRDDGFGRNGESFNTTAIEEKGDLL